MNERPASPLRKRGAVVLILAGLAVLGVLWTLSAYKLDLVHLVVVNATIQKAPAGYPRKRIASVFSRARSEAVESHSEARYLEQLLSLSQRLEKVQSLTASQVEEVLRELAPPQD